MAPVEPVAMAIKVCSPPVRLVRPLQLQFPASFTVAEQICLLPSVTVTVSRQQRFDLQVYSGGKWYSADSEYFTLGTSGKSAVYLEAPGRSGIKARMRSVYVNGSSGDNVNTTTYGSWKYLYFSN
ncbi:hypothetical protein ACWD62_14150 [Streptomyces sp. NPDC005146]